MNSASHNNRRGFTLIEVLISIFIMTFISIGIYQATVETFRLRDRLTVEGEFYNAIRFGLDIVQRDIMMMYNPTMILPLADQPGVKKETPNQTNPFGDVADPNSQGQTNTLRPEDAANLAPITKFFLEALPAYGIRPMRFQGTKDKLSFLSAGHHRIYADSKESELEKVSYFLGEDERKEGLEKDASTQALIKSSSPNFNNDDDDKDVGYKSLKLLYGVKSLSFRYCKIDAGSCKWQSDWDSDRSDTKFSFPDLIEISLEILGPQKLRYEGKYQFRPEMPLRGLSPSS